MTRLNRNFLLASLLITLWAAAMFIAYWWYEARYLRSFSEQAELFYGERLRLPAELAGPGPIRLVHFWDPSCPCNVGNQQHLAELIKRFSLEGVSFYALQKAGSRGELPETLNALEPLPALSGSDQIPASPAVAIWDQAGQLAYVGPYSAGVTCTASGSFIEPILDALRSGRQVNAGEILAVGCFCDWQRN